MDTNLGDKSKTQNKYYRTLPNFLENLMLYRYQHSSKFIDYEHYALRDYKLNHMLVVYHVPVAK